ncbi:MAG TPA: Wzz/FepE/Etk N-terminal domain-containing protein [Candidatus Binatia bacterium]
MNESVREFLHILFKRKRFFVIAFALVSLPIIAFALLRTPEYMARAKLLVVGSRSYLHLSPQDSKRTTQLPEAQVLNAEVENLKNRSFLLAAAERLQIEIIDPVPEDREQRNRATARAIRDNLRVTPFPQSPMIEVAFKHTDKNKAAAVVNTLVDTYLEYHPSIYESPDIVRFFERRTERLERELRKKERRLDRYQRRTGIVALNQQKDETIRQMMASELVLRETEAQIQQTDQLIAKLEEAMQDEPEKVASDVDMIDNPVARALEERIGILTVELSELQQKYTDADRRVIDKKAQIAELRAKVKEQPPRIIGTERFQLNQVRQNLAEELLRARANRGALEAKRESVKQHLADFEARLAEISEKGYKLQKLDDEVQQARAELQASIQRAQEARLSLEMSEDKLDTIRVVDRADAPAKPDNDQTMLTIIIALIAGVGVGVAGAFGLEFLYQTYHFGSDIERELELPVLGLISDYRVVN